MKKRKAVSILSFIMALILGVSSIFTYTASAADETKTLTEKVGETKETTETTETTERESYGTAFGGGSNAEILNPTKPTDYDENDTSNPFGVTKQENFMMFQQMELFGYSGNEIDANTQIQLQTTRKDEGTEKVLGGTWEQNETLNYGTIVGMNDSPLFKECFVQAVPFDPYNTGREDHIAFIGVCKDADGNKKANVWVFDSVNRKMSAGFDLGTMNWIKDLDGSNDNITLAYQVHNFLSITAGNFDNDGKDTIVAYAAIDGNAFTLAELFASSDDSGIHVSKKGRKHFPFTSKICAGI